jgi:hypothetical protein
VKTLVSQQLPPSRYTVQWDGTDATGRLVGSGVYVYQLRMEGTVQTRQMILLR